MLESIETIPWFRQLAAAALTSLVIEVCIVVISAHRLAQQRRARRATLDGNWGVLGTVRVPSRLLEIVASIVPIALAVAFGAATQSARNLMHHAMVAAMDPGDKATLASRAMSGEMNAISAALWSVGIVGALACVAVGLAIGARLRARGLRCARSLATNGDTTAAVAWLRFPAPQPFVIVAAIATFGALVFGPIVHAEFTSIVFKLQRWKEIATAPVEMKGRMFDKTLDDVRALQDAGVMRARIGIGIAAVSAVVLAWQFSAARARARVLGPLPRTVPRAGLATAGGAIAGLAAAAAVFMAGERMRRENRLSWPPYDGGERLMALIATPDLDGPDQLERAPVIHVTPEAMGLDGSETDAATLEEKLGTLHQMYLLLHPGDTFNGRAIILCQRDTPIGRVAAVIRAALRAQFPNPSFVFLRRQVVDRPLLGHLWRNLARAAHVAAIASRTDAAADATTIELANFATCADLSKAIVEARTGRHDVALLLP